MHTARRIGLAATMMAQGLSDSALDLRGQPHDEVLPMRAMQGGDSPVLRQGAAGVFRQPRLRGVSSLDITTTPRAIQFAKADITVAEVGP